MKASPLLAQLSFLLLCACALACQTADELLGSACPHGVCAQATAARDGLACAVSMDWWQIAVQPDDELPKQCLPTPILSSASGQLPCRMGIRPLAPGVTLLALGVEQCADQPFLEAGSYSDPYDHERSVGGPFCFVRQLSAGQRGEGGEEGWFYSELDGCPRVELTAAAKSFALAHDVDLQLICATASAPNPEGGHSSVDPDLCGDSNSVSTRDVGAACMPSIIPEEGFDPHKAYFEARSEQCQTGGCLVRLLDGDPSPD
ncbi:MAG TPA: hypothetical protein VK524_01525, partial [Polyangiaceae bacterium]|nr:hypothetical protein [Polyangiaceae bacterium]